MVTLSRHDLLHVEKRSCGQFRKIARDGEGTGLVTCGTLGEVCENPALERRR
jgi:hypothetical protein